MHIFTERVAAKFAAEKTNVGQDALGRLTPRFEWHISKYFQPIPGPVLCILAEDFVNSISVYSKDLHSTPLHLFKMFSDIIIIESLWQDVVQQNRGVKCPHAWAFCPKQWGRFVSRIYFFVLNKHTNAGAYQWNKIDIRLMKTILSDVKSLQIPISARENQIIALEVWP